MKEPRTTNVFLWNPPKSKTLDKSENRVDINSPDFLFVPI